VQTPTAVARAHKRDPTAVRRPRLAAVGDLFKTEYNATALAMARNDDARLRAKANATDCLRS